MKLPFKSSSFICLIFLAITGTTTSVSQQLFIDAGLHQPRVVNVSYAILPQEDSSSSREELSTTTTTELPLAAQVEDVNDSSEEGDSGQEEFSEESLPSGDSGEEVTIPVSAEFDLLQKKKNETEDTDIKTDDDEKDNAVVVEESKNSAVVIASPTDLKASATGYGGGYGGGGGQGGSG